MKDIRLTTHDMVLIATAISHELTRPTSTDYHPVDDHKTLRKLYYDLVLAHDVTFHMNPLTADTARGMYEEWDYSDYPRITRVVRKR